MAVEPCVACGSVEGRVVDRARDRMYGIDGSWDLWECRCGLLTLLDPPRGEALSRHYPKQASENSLRKEAPFDPTSRKERFDRAHYRAKFDPTYRSLARPLLRALPLRTIARGMRLGEGRAHLDIGCHTGRFLEWTRSFGVEAHGVELDPHAARVARDKGLDVVTGTLFDAKFPADRFDVVTLNHVFEHLPDPVAHLDEIHRILKPGGVLILATPNPASLLRKAFGPSWVHLDAPRHLHLYPPKVLARMARDHGFLVDKTRYTTSYGYVLSSMRYRANERDPSRAKKLHEPHGAWGNRWLDRAAALPLGALNVARQGEEYEMHLVKRAGS